MAFAALGAADVLDDRSGDHRPATSAAGRRTDDDRSDPAPGRGRGQSLACAYANATLAEAVIAAGARSTATSSSTAAWTMLEWLLDLETPRGHLSVIGVGGRGPDDSGPQFDQQPIEVAAMADACWRACTVTGRSIVVARRRCRGRLVHRRQRHRAARCTTATPAEVTTGCSADGVNLNQGAESTLAFISTMQRARSLVAVTP